MWLLLKDPSYPLPLVQCLRSCWEQQHKQRPTAKKIEETFQISNCLKLRNSYEMKDSVVTAAVLTSRVENGMKEESIWVAVCSKDGLHYLVSCIFSDHRIASLKLVRQETNPVHPKLYESVSRL